MKRKLEAVVTDMDGSLLGPDWEIGEQDKKTIARLRELGIPVFVATGRHQSICRWYFDELGTDYPTITSNGALLYDFATDSILEKEVISPEDVQALVEFTKQNGLLYYLYTDTHCLLNPGDAESPSFKSDMELCRLARDDESGLMEPGFNPLEHTVVKMMIPDCTAEKQAIFLQTDVGKRLCSAMSGHNFMDINPPGSNKGVAVRRLAEQYGFSMENTLAMGDNFNDEQMLRSVGIPVVPSSGVPDMQALAAFVTTASGDNPLTHAIESLFPGLL